MSHLPGKRVGAAEGIGFGGDAGSRRAPRPAGPSGLRNGRERHAVREGPAPDLGGAGWRTGRNRRRATADTPGRVHRLRDGARDAGGDGATAARPPRSRAPRGVTAKNRRRFYVSRARPPAPTLGAAMAL